MWLWLDVLSDIYVDSARLVWRLIAWREEEKKVLLAATAQYHAHYDARAVDAQVQRRSYDRKARGA